MTAKGDTWSTQRRLNMARRNTDKTRAELLAFVGMLTRLYDAHLCPTRRPQRDEQFGTVVCVHVPGVTLSWQLRTDEERALFSDLPMRDNDSERMTQEERLTHIHTLTPSLR